MALIWIILVMFHSDFHMVAKPFYFDVSVRHSLQDSLLYQLLL